MAKILFQLFFVLVIFLLFADGNQMCGTIGKLPDDVSEYPFGSSFLQIFPWMRPSCSGFVRSVTFATFPSPSPRLFYLATFTLKRLKRSAYFQLRDYLPVGAFLNSSDNTVVTMKLPSDILRVNDGTYFGIFYDNWDIPQNMSVIRHLSVPKQRVPDKQTTMFPCYVGFVGLEELTQITQLRVDSDLVPTADDRIPALSIEVVGVQVDIKAWPDRVKQADPVEMAVTSMSTTTSVKAATTTTKTTTTTTTTTTAATKTTLRATQPTPPTTREDYDWPMDSFEVTGRSTPTRATPMASVTRNAPLKVLGEGPSCGPAPKVPNAFIIRQSLDGLNGKPGDDIWFACNEGYQLKGNSSQRIFCRNPGPKWSMWPDCGPKASLVTTTTISTTTEEMPTIIKDIEDESCGELAPEVPFAFVVRQLFAGPSKLGDEVQYACQAGYKLVPGSNFRVFCLLQDTKTDWSPYPICEPEEFVGDNSTLGPTPDGPTSCIIPSGAITNGLMISKTFDDRAIPGDKITFRCEKGYQLVPATEFGPDIICFQSGLWSTLPSCVAEKIRCYNLPNVPHAFIHKQTFLLGMFPTEGDSITLMCREGYSIKGNPTLTCMANAQWSDTAECVPNNPKIAEQTRPTPPPKRLPQSTQITPAFMMSLSHCGPPPKIAHAAVTLQSWTENIKVGDFAIYSCDETVLRPVGLSKAICLGDGTWAITFKCASLQDDKPYVNAMFSCGRALQFSDAQEISRSFTDLERSISRVGDYAIYKCTHGGRIHGMQTVFCLADGSWSVGFHCDDFRL